MLQHRMGGLMKSFTKKITSVTAAAVMALCSSNIGFSFGADTETKEKCTIHYDLSGDGVYIPDDEDGNPQTIEDDETAPNTSVFVTNVEPARDGYIFSCWSYDDIRAFTPGSAMQVYDDDVTLHPVWVDEEDDVFHKVIFRVEKDGVIDKDAEKIVPPQNMITGRYVVIPNYTFPIEGYKQRGWTDGVNEFDGDTKIVVRDEDIILRPNLKKIYMLRYSAGDVDGIIGTTSQEYENIETGSTNLQGADRFSRIGYEIESWHCVTDGKDYAPTANFIMPSSDVLMVPNWVPIRYVIVFRPGTGSKDNIKVPGYTGTEITVPECTVTKAGFTFGGWQLDDTVVQPGEQYTIKGTAPGLGIAFNAIWNAEGSDVTTTSTTTSATTTTVTSTTSANTTTTSETTSTTSTTSDTSTATTSTTTGGTAKTVYGDSNCDGTVELADAILLMQAMANPDKYGTKGSDEKHLTDQGVINGDVDSSVVGITANDALMIQEFLLHKINTLDPAAKA